MADTITGHILTQTEAMNALHISSLDEYPNLDMELSGIDDQIETETGFNWATTTDTYTAIDPTAKLCASILLICFSEGTEIPQTYQYKILQLANKVKEAATSV
ncbi:MAG: hypothetical protein PHX79_07145 [Sphaerochaetaceae bacterium]|nr:hypothetical protein [Sphaerochaetaceae bacterium]